MTLTDDPQLFYYKPGTANAKFIELNEHTEIEKQEKVRFIIYTYEDENKKKKLEYIFRAND